MIQEMTEVVFAAIAVLKETGTAMIPDNFKKAVQFAWEGAVAHTNCTFPGKLDCLLKVIWDHGSTSFFKNSNSSKNNFSHFLDHLNKSIHGTYESCRCFCSISCWWDIFAFIFFDFLLALFNSLNSFLFKTFVFGIKTI